MDPSRSVLPVEDDARERELARLRPGGGEGRSLHLAASPEGALRFLADRSSDPVVSGLGMPGMGGTGLMRAMRGRGDRAPLAIVAPRADAWGSKGYHPRRHAPNRRMHRGR